MSNYKHGLSYTKAYASWRRMMNRCYNPKAAGYADYGGRGIYVWAAWHSVEAFYSELGDAPGKGRAWSIDRKDTNGNYVPGNVHWVYGQTVQSRNRRNNVYLEFKGERLLLVEWADRLGLKDDVIRERLKSGRSIEQALSPLREFDIVEYSGRRLTRSEWDRFLGLAHGTVKARLERGWPLDRVLSTRKGRGVELQWRGESHRISEWAKILGIKKVTLKRRLSAGWGVEKALSTSVEG